MAQETTQSLVYLLQSGTFNRIVGDDKNLLKFNTDNQEVHDLF